jgi:hypothetical protein
LEFQEIEKSRKLPKFKTLDNLTVLMRQDQIVFLEALTLKIMGSRDKDHKRERITKNSIIRACVDSMKNLDIDWTNIEDEKELSRRIAQGWLP